MVKYFTLKNRIKYYQYVTDFLKNIDKDSCIKPKSFKSRDGKIHNGYTVNNIVDLQKQIGTKSAYGVIYKTSVKNMLGSSPIAAKLFTVDETSEFEVHLNELISRNILKNYVSRHFLLSYKTFECKEDTSNVPSNIKYEDYYITLNELAHGDLFQLCQNNLVLQNEELLINLACQCLLSIMTFHKMGFIHRDTHWGNFLYHINEDKGGYYHYRINNQNYYLKSCVYTIMLYDFGLSEKINARWHDVTSYRQDLDRILYAFRNQRHNGWYKPHENAPNDRISKYFEDLTLHIRRTATKYLNVDKIYEEILITFLNAPIRGIFTNVRPPNGKILNEIPYVIDNSLQGLMTN
jgi:serine/threonine protein kinase